MLVEQASLMDSEVGIIDEIFGDNGYSNFCIVFGNKDETFMSEFDDMFEEAYLLEGPG